VNVGGRETSIRVLSNFANTTIPDLKFDIKEVLVAGDCMVVGGEVTGTPAAARSVAWPRRQSSLAVHQPGGVGTACIAHTVLRDRQIWHRLLTVKSIDRNRRGPSSPIRRSRRTV
jgi:hypothetical protein